MKFLVFDEIFAEPQEKVVEVIAVKNVKQLATEIIFSLFYYTSGTIRSESTITHISAIAKLAMSTKQRVCSFGARAIVYRVVQMFAGAQSYFNSNFDEDFNRNLLNYPETKLLC